jgi:hypothetical protein
MENSHMDSRTASVLLEEVAHRIMVMPEGALLPELYGNSFDDPLFAV